jgi:hypothetical protein
VQGNPAARDLIRHAFADVGGNTNRARSWAKFVRRWPFDAQRELLDAYPRIELPGAAAVGRGGSERAARVGAGGARPAARRAAAHAAGTGFLIAYDDPVACRARADRVLF